MLPDLLDFFKWYLVIAACGLLALPLVHRFLRHLPDRGYAFTKPFGLLLIGYLFWLGGSLGLWRNDAAGMLLAAGVVGGLGLAGLRRKGLVELWMWLEDRIPVILAVEVLFLGAFALLAVVRAYNPEIVSTEKPMEFMFINSILRSPTFPPHDAWLSGHAISYYYFGYVLIAALARLTGTDPGVAFNLGLALLFALAAVGALGVTLNLIALARQERARMDMEANPPLLASFWPGLLGPLLVVVVGNFYGLFALAHANGALADAQVWAVRYDFGEVDPADPARVIRMPAVQAGAVGLWDWLDLKGLAGPSAVPAGPFQWDPGFWWWFNGARVVHDRDLLGDTVEAIDEMPAFSFVLGDMHPHVLALPFVILAIGLALDWMLWARTIEVDVPYAVDRLALTAVVLGGLAFLNTWDFPIYWFLIGLAAVVGLATRWGWGGVRARWRGLALGAGILALASPGLYFPYLLTFQSQAGGLLPNLIFPTRFQQLFVMFGPLLIGLALFLGWLVVRRRGDVDWPAGAGAAGLLLAGLLSFIGLTLLAVSANPEIANFVDGLLQPLTRSEALWLMWLRRGVDSLSALAPLIVIAVTAALLSGALRESGRLVKQHGGRAVEATLRSPAVMLALAMAFTGALLVLAPEFVYLRDNFGSRMNTMFKFYFQAWVLWALAVAFGVWYLAQYASLWVRRGAAAVMTLSVMGGLLYTLPAIYSKTGHFAGQPTLDGMKYFAEQYPDDWAAIQWLDAHAPDEAVIAEGIGGQYWIEGRYSRISMATGLAAVLGWPGHEGQWRGGYFAQVAGRESEIRELYLTNDWDRTRAILTTYNIRYVVVSPLEYQKYGAVYLPKFERNLRLVFESGEVKIYEWRPPAS